MNAVDIRKITGHALHNKAARRMHVSVQMVLCTFFQRYACISVSKAKKRELTVSLSRPIRLSAASTGYSVVVHRFPCGYKGVVLWL